MTDNSFRSKIFLTVIFIWLATLSVLLVIDIRKNKTVPGLEDLGLYSVKVDKTEAEAEVENKKDDRPEKEAETAKDTETPAGTGSDEEIMYFAKALTTDIKVPEKLDFAGEAVPLHRIDVEESLIRELTVNTYMHSSTLTIMKKFPRVSKMLLPILREENVPEDFIYLAVCESALNELAYSPARAAGMWQFIESTGKVYHLKINNSIDERYNIEKATRAACRYLKSNKERFGSWTLAAAAYNCGELMVEKQQNKQKFTSYYDLRLPTETNRYMFRILAFKEILSHPERYNFKISGPFEDEPCTKVRIKTRIKDLAVWAKTQGISYKTLKRFNPWLRDNFLIASEKDQYDIRIPVNKDRYR